MADPIRPTDDQAVLEEDAFRARLGIAIHAAGSYEVHADTAARRVRARIVVQHLNEAWLALNGKLPGE